MGKIPAIPSVPSGIDLNLKTFLSSIKTTLDYREGRLRDKTGRFITAADIPKSLKTQGSTKTEKINLNDINGDGIIEIGSQAQLTIVAPEGVVIYGQGGLTICGGGSLAVDTEESGAGLIVGDFNGGEGWQMNNNGLVSYTLNHQLHAFVNVENIPWQQSCSIPGIDVANPSFTLGAGDVVLGMFNYEVSGVGLGGIFWDQSDRKLYIRGEVIAGTGSEIDWSNISGASKPDDNADVTAFNNNWSDVVNDNALKPFDNADVTQTVLDGGADVSGVRVSGNDLIVDGKISTSLLEISNGRTFSVLGSGFIGVNTETEGSGLIIGDFSGGEGWQMNNTGLFSYTLNHPLHAFANTNNIPWQQSCDITGVQAINSSFSLDAGDVVLGMYNYETTAGVELGGLYWDNTARELNIRADILNGNTIYGDIANTVIGLEDLIDGNLINTDLLTISDGRTFSVLGSGKIYVDTNTDGHGLVVGNWSTGDGWQINNKGIFSYTLGLGMSALSSYVYDVPWQRNTKTFPAGTLSPINASFNLGPGDAIFGPFNYKWGDGTPAGGLFINTFDSGVSGSKTAIYLKGDIYIDGDVSITGNAVTFEDWNNITGSNFPEPNATYNSGDLADQNRADLDYTDGADVTADNNKWSDVINDIGTRPTDNADVTADVFAATTLNKTAGDLIINLGADLVMEGGGGDTSIIEFRPNPLDQNTFVRIRGLYSGSKPILEISPYTGTNGEFYIGNGLGINTFWNSISGYATSSIYLAAGGNYLHLSSDHCVINTDLYLFSTSQIEFGTSHHLWKSNNDLYWFDGTNNTKLNDQGGGGTLADLGVTATASEINTVADGSTAKNSHTHSQYSLTSHSHTAFSSLNLSGNMIVEGNYCFDSTNDFLYKNGTSLSFYVGGMNVYNLTHSHPYASSSHTHAHSSLSGAYGSNNDINTSGSSIIDNIYTDDEGHITSCGSRTLSYSDVGACSSSDYRLSNDRYPTSHSHSGYASSTDSRFLTTTQKTDLTDGGITSLHDHSAVYSGSTAKIAVYSSYIKSYDDFHPSSTSHKQGTTLLYWSEVYAYSFRWKNADVGSQFDLYDDLQIIQDCKVLKNEKNEVLKDKDDIAIYDPLSLPDPLTNITDLAEKYRTDVKTLREINEGISDPFDIEIEEDDDETDSKKKKIKRIDKEAIQDELFYDAGKMIWFGLGATKQLNKELTEDIYEEFNTLIEDLLLRVNTLEKQLQNQEIKP